MDFLRVSRSKNIRAWGNEKRKRAGEKRVLGPFAP